MTDRTRTNFYVDEVFPGQKVTELKERALPAPQHVNSLTPAELRSSFLIEDLLQGCVTNVSANLQSCTEDGSGPPGVGFQELASNHPEPLRSKGVVVNVRGKGVRRGRQVSV